MLNPWDLDDIADGDAQNFANVESLIWSHMMDVLAAEQKQQPDDAKPSEWQQAMLDHADEVRKFAEQVTGKPQKNAMLTLQTKLGPMTYNNMKRAEAWLKAHTHKPVADIKDSKQIAKIVEAGQVKGEKYINLASRNMSDNALTQFDKIVSTASLNMRNGTTNQKALSQAAKQWAAQGVPALIDKAGRHWSPDVYMRTVIESAVNQTTNDTELARYKQYGSLVRVDSHAGCRPTHLQFQDQIYSLTGDTEKYPDFESTTGYGTITGIGGINCRHHTLPYVEGEGYMKVPQMSADDNATLYYNKQAQRRLESNVRKAKRQLEAAEKLGGPADIANAKQLVTRRQTAVREFVNDKGLTRRYYREKINIIKEPKNISSVATKAAETDSMSISELENMFVNDQIKNVIDDDEKIKTIVSTLSKAPDNIKAMYEKYSDKMKITTANGNGSSFYSPLNEAVSFNHDSLFLDKEMTKNTRVMNEVYYHEFGHMIDDFSSNKAFEKTSESEKYGFKAKLNNDFQNIVNSEIDNINKNGLPKEKVFHDDVINTDYYGEMYGLMIKRKKNGKLTQSSIKKIAVKKVIDDMLEKATATETSWKPYTNIADMFEAATKGNYRTGFGHGKKYWKNPGMQEAEAFAEMTSSSVCNPESLELIKHYFPTAYEAYLQMIADIVKE